MAFCGRPAFRGNRCRTARILRKRLSPDAEAAVIVLRTAAICARSSQAPRLMQLELRQRGDQLWITLARANWFTATLPTRLARCSKSDADIVSTRGSSGRSVHFTSSPRSGMTAICASRPSAAPMSPSIGRETAHGHLSQAQPCRARSAETPAHGHLSQAQPCRPRSAERRAHGRRRASAPCRPRSAGKAAHGRQASICANVALDPHNASPTTKAPSFAPCRHGSAETRGCDIITSQHRVAFARGLRSSHHYYILDWRADHDKDFTTLYNLRSE